MLKKFVLRNYKNFKEDICVDFGNIAGYQFSLDCIINGLIGKMLIYGRNATGKTNLGRAILDVKRSLLGSSGYLGGRDAFLNADSAEDKAYFHYVFEIDGCEVIYRYTRHANRALGSEELIIDGLVIFKCDFVQEEYTFDHLNHVDAETVNVERYLQSLSSGLFLSKRVRLDESASLTESLGFDREVPLSFLRWMVNNAALKQDSLLLKLLDYVERMYMMTVSGAMALNRRMMNENFFESLEETKNLKELEEFLNVMGITCELVLKKLPDGQNELYFAHEKLIPFYRNASSGTLALVDLYQRFVSVARNASFLYLDEFDAFYHYEMAENVIRFFKQKYPKCQIIMTSHNTNLITNRLMRPDCLFILSRKGTLTALCDATARELREGHNLEKMYISGEFERYE